jgi:two-component system phosphate regulon sensor histidine kinase PhoR
MMKTSIFMKIFTGYVLVIFALVALILVFSLATIEEHYLDTQARSLEHLGNSLKLGVKPLYFEGDAAALDSLVKELGEDLDTRITIIDSTGVVLADSERDPLSMDNHRSRPEVAAALRGRIGKSNRLSTTVQEDMLYVAVPLEKDGAVKGVLRVSSFLRAIEYSHNRLRGSILVIAIVVTILALLAALVFSRGLSQPIRKLRSASQRVASGDFDTVVLLRGSDEARDLADSFNYMTGQIRSLVAELTQQREELRGIVTSIQDGLLVLDKNGRILLTNKAVGDITGRRDIEGRPYWEVMRVPELDELVREVAKQRTNGAAEIRYGDRTYRCSGAFLESQEAVVILIHDITEMKTVETVKRDFVVNLSHELRTPLTAIKGFAETIEDEASESARRYVGIIKRHTDRLISIVEDLLRLSELEDPAMSLELTEVDLTDLLSDVLRVFDQRLKQKGLGLEFNPSDERPVIRGDRFKLEQVFMNLISNAVKYTDQGGIRISLEQQDGNAIVQIQDTGIGIPAEHLPRVFERFYVVDKSRSKTVGGTGLGLSIVKHIVLLHNGTIDVESEPGKGTRFRIILPQCPI